MSLRQLLLFTLAPLLIGPMASAATLRWDDINAPGTSYIISNKVGAAWQNIGHTTNKTFGVTLVPGTNTFSLVASNGLLSDPAVTSTNQPTRVFNVIIEASNDVGGPFEPITNQPAFVAVVGERRFYRLRANIQ